MPELYRLHPDDAFTRREKEQIRRYLFGETTVGEPGKLYRITEQGIELLQSRSRWQKLKGAILAKVKW